MKAVEESQNKIIDKLIYKKLTDSNSVNQKKIALMRKMSKKLSKKMSKKLTIFDFGE